MCFQLSILHLSCRRVCGEDRASSKLSILDSV
jgi:hypothetical protein